jgi:hypothetical protein
MVLIIAGNDKLLFYWQKERWMVNNFTSVCVSLQKQYHAKKESFYVFIGCRNGNCQCLPEFR